MNSKKTVTFAAAGAALAGALLAAGAGVAGAEPIESSDTISLSIGSVKVLESADLVKATQVAGAVCNIDAAEANTVAQKAATETTAQTVCNLPGGPVTFAQASAVSQLPQGAMGWPSEQGHSTAPVDPSHPTVGGASTNPVEQLPG
jgi:hypothetical protein